MTQFLNIIVQGSDSIRVRNLIEQLEHNGKNSRFWYSQEIKLYSVKDVFEAVNIRFALLHDFNQIEQLLKDELEITHSAILHLDATEHNIREKIEDTVNLLRKIDNMTNILVLIMNAAPKKNNKGILSRRQAKYFITGLNNDLQIDLQYKELSDDPSDNQDMIWQFIEETVESHMKN